jgi:tetratricopeptide (TPR) repeat protein
MYLASWETRALQWHPWQAETCFDKAARLANELGDTEARFGFLGNRGSVLAWQGRYKEAIPDFEKVLGFVRKQGEQSAEIQALRHLAQAHSKLKENDSALNYARQGVELCKVNDDETMLSFYEIIIISYYRQGKIREAQVTNRDAISFARKLNNSAKELEFLLSLGEAQFLSELHEDALQTYQKALELAKQLSRRSDEAYLTGRVGVMLAELGQLDEAIQYHSQAVDLARLWLFPRLEGEQLSMLAMAHFEKGDIRQAREYCHLAIQVFSEAGLNEEIQKASQLFKQISA